MTRCPSNDGPAACERAGAPVERTGVSGHDAYFLNIYAQHLGHDLSQGREMTLTLRPHPRCHAHFPTGLDGHTRPFVRPDAGPLHITRHANTDMTPGLAKPRLFLAYEPFVVDDACGLFHRRQVVAAVIDQRRRVLEHDLVIVRKPVGTKQIAFADLDAIDAEIPGANIEQALDHEHTMLPPGTANGCDERLVGEDGRELTLVVDDVVGTEQRALTVDRDRQAVRCRTHPSREEKRHGRQECVLLD